MAKERMVNTKFWDDTYISELQKEGKLLYLYLLTNPLTNIAGVYEIQDRRMIFDTGLTKEELEAMKVKLQKDNKVLFLNGWVGIVNFTKHQKQNPKVSKGILLALEVAPKELVEKMSIDYDRLSIVYNTLSHSNSNSNLNSNSNSNLNTNTKKRSAKRTSTPIKEEKVEKVVKEVKKFIKPTLEEVEAYCKERNNKVNPQKFIDHYESNGWKVGGKSAMKDWKASVRTWEGNNFGQTTNGGKPMNVLVTPHAKTLADVMQKKADENKSK